MNTHFNLCLASVSVLAVPILMLNTEVSKQLIAIIKKFEYTYELELLGVDRGVETVPINRKTAVNLSSPCFCNALYSLK